MGYSEVEASIAMERCGSDSSIAELTDFICTAQLAKAADTLLLITQRTLSEYAIGPPYFYYENVVFAPVGVWTEMSRNKVIPLEPDEVEIIPGFPKNHIRGEGSVRDMFPCDINVLSLFSRISDVEVAFYCLSIPLKVNVQELNGDQLEQLMSRFVEFDLVVGDIPFLKFKFKNLLKDIMDIILTKKMIDMKEATTMHQDLNQYHGITRVQVDSVINSILQNFWLLGSLAFKRCEILHHSGLAHSFSSIENLRNAFGMYGASSRA
ncbi:hypothetical protein F3Y22_tig00005294pilonHSYRG00097 [Hibiscus syriacus]|uniref:DNA (Cytosine-5)-methyltransferase DRM1/2 n=1 Tax=Hibiscus syriacus TaxID=106335 RepID=A0A6A3CJT8_HIBSY|nr:hypothetical protein F3Y22_tig00005294pilonHSYRG00097 [Hibiscus syriacus]